MISALARFHPHTRAWFEANFPAPTDVQARSWPVISAGRHALITAPTGSGKTLTAFLWALDAFAASRYTPGATRVLYISPLKALNNDIQRNLLEPLGGLRARFEAANEAFPEIHVQVRSGDTDASERQRMLRRPPEILITTPESLALLLTTPRGRHALATVETVILDEIHGVADNRRGTVLMTALERLARCAGEFQRIALSATVHPLADIAAFVAGLDNNHMPRPIDIIEGRDDKQIEFRVRFPDHVRAALDAGAKIWEPLTQSFRAIIAANAATLFFTNSRRLAEKITLTINSTEAAPLAYAHHGSLAREIRSEVEQRLKSGVLRAIVATNSLEMGIDIGSLDEVVLIQSPPSIASTLQRIGRAGHRVGDISRGTLFPTHARDFLEGAALAECIEARELEPLAVIENPLDVLAQIIISMTASETWMLDDIYALLRQSYSYRTLPRDQFELVVEMLAGRYAGSRVRDLELRVVYDRIEQTLRAAKGAVYALYTSGGTIPDRGYYHLRHADTGALIGDLDEEFVFEAQVGQTFAFGTQDWQIKRITHNDVLASPAKVGSVTTPFWKAEPYNRSFHYSSRIGDFLERTQTRLDANDEAGFFATLTTQHGFDAAAARELVDYLQRQRAHTAAALPHRHHVLVEYVQSGPGGYHGPDQERQIVLHTLWGGRVNRPYALVLSAVWQATHGYVPEVHADDDAIVIQVKGDVDPARVIDLVRADGLDGVLHNALERSGFFGARFRECAGRALLVTRQRFNQRLPLWMSRLHAKQLLTTVKQYADFPVLLETFRTCLVDEFDLPALYRVLADLESGEIAVTCVTTAEPSPFAADIAWGQITPYMYADDSPESNAASALSGDLIRAAVFDAALRPRIDRGVIEAFIAKRQRTAPGYGPTDATELGEWLKERVLIPAAQWRELALANSADAASAPVYWLVDGERRWAVHAEVARSVTQRLTGTVDDDLVDTGDPRDQCQLLREILSFYGPLTRDDIAALLPLPAAQLDGALGELVDDGALVAGPLIAGDDAIRYCDVNNLEILLRQQRASARHRLEPRALTDLPGFFAAWHRFGRNVSDDALAQTSERLRGYTADVDVWLNDLIDARHGSIDPHRIDAALDMNGFAWVGHGADAVTLMPIDDLALLGSAPDESGGSEADAAGVSIAAATAAVVSAFRDRAARYSFFQLVDASGLPTDGFSDALWRAVWQGRVSADSLSVLRTGSLRDYTLTAPAPLHPRSAQHHSALAHSPLRGAMRRSGRGAGHGWPGHWFLLPAATESADEDPLTALETAKDRVRILLDRYGIVSREIANREGGEFRWAALFRSLRIMELSGEIVAGLFFHGLSGPQFAAPSAIRQLERGGSGPESFWVNATDPVAPTGLGVEWPKALWPSPLPHRRASNYLAFHRSRVVLIAEGYGRRLSFGGNLDDAEFAAATALLSHLLSVRRKLSIESIDGDAPSASPYVARLADIFDVARDHKGVDLLLPAARIG